MENPLWLWVVFALVLAIILMPFEQTESIAFTQTFDSSDIGLKKEEHKDTHKLHFSMSPFWSNEDGVFTKMITFK